jgi:hypothetical protein
MAANDIKTLKSKYGSELFRTEANVKLGMAPGDAVIVAGSGTNYVDLLLDGMPTRGTDVFVGITKSGAANIPNTAAANGVQIVELVGPGTILEGKATTAANVNTDAKLLGMLNDTTNFDRSAATAAGILTIDETNTTAKKSSTLSLVIISGDINKGTLRVAVTGGGIIGGSNI